MVLQMYVHPSLMCALHSHIALYQNYTVAMHSKYAAILLWCMHCIPTLPCIKCILLRCIAKCCFALYLQVYYFIALQVCGHPSLVPALSSHIALALHQMYTFALCCIAKCNIALHNKYAAIPLWCLHCILTCFLSDLYCCFALYCKI